MTVAKRQLSRVMLKSWRWIRGLMRERVMAVEDHNDRRQRRNEKKKEEERVILGI